MNDTILPLEDSPDLVLVRDAARGVFESQWPALRAAALVADPTALVAFWKVAATQGWTSLGLDDELGLSAALALLQESGRANCPLPLLEAVLANAALASCLHPAAQSLLAQLPEGHTIVSWVFGPLSGESDAFELRTQLDASLTGRAAFIEHAQIASHFLVISDQPGELLLFSRDAPGLSILPTPGLHVPALAELLFEHVQPIARLSTSFDLALLPALARLMLAARATGAAQRGLEALVEYAGVRTQFGQKIGQYQAIQHKLANCFSAIEICRLALLRAGKVAPHERAYWAAVASANAGHLLRHTVLELHHGFGGISFWDEHEMPRHFRRVHADTTRLGGVHRARQDLAHILLEEGAMPAFSYGPEADRLRDEVRHWLAQNWDGTFPPGTEDLPLNHKKAGLEFTRKLGQQGWLGMTWPKAYGGQERTALEHLAFEEELAYGEAPAMRHASAVNMMGPTIARHGSEAQKAFFLPAIARGELAFALGYSEPDNGSDLAGLRTTARPAPDGGWLIRGQKIFTSTAGFADYVWLAVRTDPKEPRHAGISVFAVPLNSPGITIQPMHGLNDHRSNVVFYDDVWVPDDALIGELNGGWKLISEALANERVVLGAIGARARGYFDRLLAHVRSATRDGQPMARDTLVRDRIGAFCAEIEAARLLAVRTAQVVQRGAVPLWEAAMLKVHASELMERLCEAAFDLLGSGAALKEGATSSIAAGVFEYGARDALLYTIGGGTNEIQRTLIAQRGLGLPR